MTNVLKLLLELREKILEVENALGAYCEDFIKGAVPPCESAKRELTALKKNERSLFKKVERWEK